MSRTPEYRAVSNFFRNTQKLTPEELKTVVKEVVREEVQQKLREYFQGYNFTKYVREYMVTKEWHLINKAIQEAAQELFNKHFELKITQKDPA